MYWWNESRNIFELNHHVSEDEYNRVSIGLFHRKSNNSRLYKPIGFEFTYLDDAIMIDNQDIKSVAGFMEHLSISTRIIEVLKKGSMSAASIAEMTDIKLNIVKVTLSRMKAAKKVINLENMAWGLMSGTLKES